MKITQAVWIFLLLLFPSLSFAGQASFICYQGGGKGFTDPGSACQAAGGSWNGSACNPVSIYSFYIYYDDTIQKPGPANCEVVSKCGDLKNKTFSGAWKLPLNGNPPNPACNSNCSAEIDSGTVLNKKDNSGSTFFGTYRYTGDSCQEGPPTPSPDAPDPNPSVCPAGTIETKDSAGYSHCHFIPDNNNPNPSEAPPTSGGPPAGGGTGGAASGPNATASGSNGAASGTNATASGSHATASGTTTTTTANGVKVTVTVNQKSFCADNPGLAICKNGTFTGSCSGGFSCTGDAIACANAKAVAETKCALDPNTVYGNSQEMVNSGKQAISEGQDKYAGEGGSTLGRVNSATVNFFTYDTEDGSCPAPAGGTVLGAQFYISFDPICTLARLLRPLVLAAALIAGFFVLKSGI